MKLAYCLKKFFYYISLMLGVILFSFVLFHMVPTDPARSILGPNASAEQVSQIKLQLGLDRPYWKQLAIYVKKAALLDFGISYVDGRDVSTEMLKRFRLTLSVIALSIVMTVFYLIGVLCTVRHPFFRPLTDGIDFILTSQPVFFSGIIVSILTVYYSPFQPFAGDIHTLVDFLYLIPAGAVVSFYPMSILSRLLKDELKTTMTSGFFVAGLSQGYGEQALIVRYVWKNAMIPVCSSFSNILPSYITGIFFVEIIFSIPGVGMGLMMAIMQRDFPMLECAIILNGLFFMLTNAGFELLYPLVDPRIGEVGIDVSS